MWDCGLFEWGLKVMELRNYDVPGHYKFCYWCCADCCQTVLVCVQANTQWCAHWPVLNGVPTVANTYWCASWGQNVLVSPLCPNHIGCHTVAKTQLCAHCGQDIVVCPLWPIHIGLQTVAKMFWWAHFGQTILVYTLWSVLNSLMPKDTYSGHTAPLISKRCILYIYSTNTVTEYFKHGIHSPFNFSSKCSLFHNSNIFGSCFIHILYRVSQEECARLREGVPYVKVYRYNPKHLCPKLNG